jgi:TolB protein
MGAMEEARTPDGIAPPKYQPGIIPFSFSLKADGGLRIIGSILGGPQLARRLPIGRPPSRPEHHRIFFRKGLSGFAMNRLLVRLFVLFLSIAPWASVPVLAQQENPDIQISEDITKLHSQATAIAIPNFKGEGTVGDIPAGFFSKTIYNDLELFGGCQRVANQTFVEQTHARDLATNKVDFAEWQRISANLVLKGECAIVQGQLEVSCQLWDVDFGHSVIHKRYSRYSLKETRMLAHHISDDIIREVFKEEHPIASTRILFVGQERGNHGKEIYVMDADGGSVRRLTFDNTIATTPCWGKNGTEIYFTSYKDHNPDLCGMQLDTGRTWFVSRRATSNFSPSWSPTVERIVLTLGRDGNSEIYTMGRDGKEATLQRLTFSSAIDSSPCWNPAGNQVVFTSSRTGSPQLYIMGADGTGLHQLTRQGKYNDSSAWSPKGDKIAFAGRDRGIFDIYAMNVDGSALMQITSGVSNNEDPSWAPDGKHIVFSSNRTGYYALYIASIDGAKARRITNLAWAQSPAWSPEFPRR